MFTGIVQGLAEIVEIIEKDEDGSYRLVLKTEELLLANSKVGDSIGLNGVCLTITWLEIPLLSAQLSQETLSCTCLGEFTIGDLLHVENPVSLSTPLGGHIVQVNINASLFY
jgi:riboflavin synthase